MLFHGGDICILHVYIQVDKVGWSFLKDVVFQST